MQQVGSYRRYSGRGANAFAEARLRNVEVKGPLVSPSQFMRRAAIAVDVGVFVERAGLVQAFLVAKDIRAAVRKAEIRKLRRERIELPHALLKNVARIIGAQERGDRGRGIPKTSVVRDEERWTR
jgi:hypothetical protein